ncbi:MAG: N-acetylgalactosamine-6-sulfatase [Acidobacteria bacterium]|nr:N-acetylgalactosamine-6-sulfatase [Acidobacteriota bacterium]
MTTRRAFLQTAAAAPALLRAQQSRPNILFILADDLGWGDLSCYGNTRTQTPNLDRLAAQGTLFTQFYVNGSVCSPTRSAFMTGRFPARNHMHGHLATEDLNKKRAMPNFLDPKIPTIARALRDAGYRTAHFGKWHLGRGPGAPMPDAYGFTHHMSVTSNETRFTEGGEGFRARSTKWMVDNALEFIRQDPGKPFYAQVWTLLPHAPLAPTPEQLKPFAKLQPAGGVPWPGAPQIYNASLKDLDDQIGRLLSELEKDGLAQNTLVIFSSDNGPEDIHIANASHSAFGSPGPFRGRKRSLYEGGVRVPGIFRLPGRIPAGRVENRAVVSAVDLFPSLAKLGGYSEPTSVDGENALDVLTGASRARAKPLHWEWRFNVAGYAVNRSPVLSMRDGDWKLLMNPDRSRVELYRIPDDPMELNNLAGANPDVVRRMSERALAWQKTLPPGPMDPEAGATGWRWPGGR